MRRRDSHDLRDEDSSSIWDAWRQLLRLANVFTALSNVLAGALLAQGSWEPAPPLILLLTSSALLYCAGMVLNDVFDAELDAQERPERPIPSGRVRREEAALVGWTLLAMGVGMAAWSSYLLASLAPIIIGASLVVTIVMYDGGLKAIWAGPLAMGWCRTLNVLLGASLAGSAVSLSAWWYAGTVGVYTLGLTLLAKEEASGRVGDTLSLLKLLMLVSISGLFLLAAFVSSNFGPLTWFLICFMTLYLMEMAVSQAISQPTPENVQLSVKRLILLFIVIDAAACSAVGGWKPALLVLSLLVPTLLLSRRTAMT